MHDSNNEDGKDKPAFHFFLFWKKKLFFAVTEYLKGEFNTLKSSGFQGGFRSSDSLLGSTAVDVCVLIQACRTNMLSPSSDWKDLRSVRKWSDLMKEVGRSTHEIATFRA